MFETYVSIIFIINVYCYVNKLVMYFMPNFAPAKDRLMFKTYVSI